MDGEEMEEDNIDANVEIMVNLSQSTQKQDGNTRSQVSSSALPPAASVDFTAYNNLLQQYIEDVEQVEESEALCASGAVAQEQAVTATESEIEEISKNATNVDGAAASSERSLHTMEAAAAVEGRSSGDTSNPQLQAAVKNLREYVSTVKNLYAILPQKQQEEREQPLRHRGLSSSSNSSSAKAKSTSAAGMRWRRLRLQQLAKMALVERLPTETVSICPHCDLRSTLPPVTRVRPVHRFTDKENSFYPNICLKISSTENAQDRLWSVLSQLEIDRDQFGGSNLSLDECVTAGSSHVTSRIGVPPWIEFFINKQRQHQQNMKRSSAQVDFIKANTKKLENELRSVRFKILSLEKLLNAQNPNDQRNASLLELQKFHRELTHTKMEIDDLRLETKEHDKELIEQMTKVAILNEDCRKHIACIVDLVDAGIAAHAPISGDRVHRMLIGVVTNVIAANSLGKRRPKRRKEDDAILCPNCLYPVTSSRFCTATGQHHFAPSAEEKKKKRENARKKSVVFDTSFQEGFNGEEGAAALAGQQQQRNSLDALSSQNTSRGTSFLVSNPPGAGAGAIISFDPPTPFLPNEEANSNPFAESLTEEDKRPEWEKRATQSLNVPKPPPPAGGKLQLKKSSSMIVGKGSKKGSFATSSPRKKEKKSVVAGNSSNLATASGGGKGGVPALNPSALLLVTPKSEGGLVESHSSPFSSNLGSLPPIATSTRKGAKGGGAAAAAGGGAGGRTPETGGGLTPLDSGLSPSVFPQQQAVELPSLDTPGGKEAHLQRAEEGLVTLSRQLAEFVSASTAKNLKKMREAPNRLLHPHVTSSCALLPNGSLQQLHDIQEQFYEWFSLMIPQLYLLQQGGSGAGGQNDLGAGANVSQLNQKSLQQSVLQLKKELRNYKFSFSKRPKGRSHQGANLDDNAFMVLALKISEFEKRNAGLKLKLKTVNEQRRTIQRKIHNLEQQGTEGGLQTEETGGMGSPQATGGGPAAGAEGSGREMRVNYKQF